MQGFAVPCREARHEEGEEDGGGGLLLLRCSERLRQRGRPSFSFAPPFDCGARRVVAVPQCGSRVDGSALGLRESAYIAIPDHGLQRTAGTPSGHV